MTTLIVTAGLLIYLALYFFYGRRVERLVVKASADRATPANRLFDGVDFMPARRDVLFGHHFASIAGAAPIVGPAIAIVWGWVPGLLWVWFGNVFIGAIHDYLALMASVRYDGKSIQFVASDIMGKRTGQSFYLVVTCVLILVVAAFASIVGGMFVNDGAIAATFVYTIASALVFGYLLYRTRLGFGLATGIGILMLIGSIALGMSLPIELGYQSWMAVFFFYIIIASSLPVNVLLQPRDYLNSFILYAGLLIGIVAAISAVRGFEVPAFSNFAPVLMGGQATPFWPVIPLVIACGALSGFHSLVASGTTSKQLRSERDALPIAMGGMYTEGFLSTIVIVSIAGFGYTAIRNAGAELGVPVALEASNWGAMFTQVTSEVNLARANLFVQSYADMIGATWLSVLPTAFVKIIAGLWVASFAMTTLDTANRLGRYCVAELVSPYRERMPGLYRTVSNRWIASLIPAFVGIYLAWSGNWLVLWGAFGAANQLIAAVALLTGAAYVAKRLRSRFAPVAMVPAMLLWITVFCATIWLLAVVMPADIAKNPVPGWTVTVLISVMLVLNVVFLVDFVRSYFFKEAPEPADTVEV